MHKHIHEQMRRDHGHLVAKPPRSPMNEFAKFIVNQSNFIFTCLGLIMMAIAFYSFFADFGEIDRGYFLGRTLSTSTHPPCVRFPPPKTQGFDPKVLDRP